MEYVLDGETSKNLTVILKNSFAVRGPDGRSYYHGDPIELTAGSVTRPALVTLSTGMGVFFIPTPPRPDSNHAGRSELVAIIFIGNRAGSTVRTRPAQLRSMHGTLLHVSIRCRGNR